ncbi:hypothetical protein ACH4PU_35075 [Streptomyces sp. NPDC021100]|uniref:hypothetical protein n=1 Tax=Streptomyces sp. NPDC021100 TaxID=3365114 RepID=UPI00379B8F2B
MAGHIERALASERRRPTADSVHGPGATRLSADDLTPDAFLDAETTMARADKPAVPCRRPGPPC